MRAIVCATAAASRRRLKPLQCFFVSAEAASWAVGVSPLQAWAPRAVAPEVAARRRDAAVALEVALRRDAEAEAALPPQFGAPGAASQLRVWAG